jgi:predicted component of type VI protein secretion system
LIGAHSEGKVHVNLALVMVDADGHAREFAISHLPTTIGREDGCKLRVPVANVSRRHCELIEDDSELVVRDLGSSNGTFVNGARVKQTELSPGDLLAVGPVVFVIKINGFPKEIDAAESFSAGSVSSTQPTAAGSEPATVAIRTNPISSPKQVAAAATKPANEDSAIDFSDLLDGIDLDDDDEAPPQAKDADPKKKK